MARANHLRRRRSQKRSRPTAAIRTMDKFHQQRIGSPSDKLGVNLTPSNIEQINLRAVLRADSVAQLRSDYHEYRPQSSRPVVFDYQPPEDDEDDAATG